MSDVRVAALHRHPVKGFSPEPIDGAQLTVDQAFPCDRMFAVENGPSGFDPAAPAHISKTRFTVLMREAGLAKLKTRYDEGDGRFHVEDPETGAHAFALKEAAGRDAFATYLAARFSERFKGPLKVLRAPAAHRFMDSAVGDVSLLNLASVAAFEEGAGARVDPMRFRMNIHIEGLDAWTEDGWAPGRRFRIGGAVLEMVKPTQRCKATHANPKDGVYDLDTVPLLRRRFDRVTMGFYARVVETGPVLRGDALILDDA